MTPSRVEMASPEILTASSWTRVAIASGRSIFTPRSASSPASLRALSLSCVPVLSPSPEREAVLAIVHTGNFRDQSGERQEKAGVSCQ
jgi:hypothetical protein